MSIGHCGVKQIATWRAGQAVVLQTGQTSLSLIAIACIAASFTVPCSLHAAERSVFHSHFYFVMARESNAEVAPPEVHHYNDISEVPWDIQKYFALASSS